MEPALDKGAGLHCLSFEVLSHSRSPTQLLWCSIDGDLLSQMLYAPHAICLHSAEHLDALIEPKRRAGTRWLLIDATPQRKPSESGLTFAERALFSSTGHGPARSCHLALQGSVASTNATSPGGIAGVQA